MFKKLRNNLLRTNMIIVSALVIGCLSAIYITTYTFVKNDTDLRLDRAINMCIETINRHYHRRDDMMRNIEPKLPRPNKYAVMPKVGGKPMAEDMFNTEISVYCDKKGNIISTQSVFDPDEFDYGSKLKEIVSSNKENGTTTLDIDSWAYRRTEYEDGYIVAFTKNETERSMLFTLMIILIIVGVVSIGVSFLISLNRVNSSIKPIEEAYNKQKQFVADASHELRTPIASISANTDVLLSKPDSVIGDEKKWLEYIKEETERMTYLINDLLLLAKSDSCENKQILTKISFSDTVKDTMLEIEATAFEKGVILESDIAENIKVNATKNGLKQIMLILMDNAIKYSDKDSKVMILLKSESGKAILEVKNAGNISDDDLPHIFERFYRADKSRASEGCGLGLAIAKSLCISFGGSINAVSGNGTTVFNVVFNKA